MMREPWFWRSGSIAARVTSTALAPLSILYDLGQRARWKITRPYKISAPIICIGNATLGGVGKTPFAIALHQHLLTAGTSCTFLTRGYGGAERGPIKISSSAHTAHEVGDEALLLARQGDTWLSKDRRDGAMAATHNEHGVVSECIIMDDGLQNPTIQKTISILLIDRDDTSSNGKIFPAGPYREPLNRARSRADIEVSVGQNQESAEAAAKKHASLFAAWLEPVTPIDPKRAVAFSGIGRPEKFFTLLKQSGFELAHEAAFPDHHPFTTQNLAALNSLASHHQASLITTEKDYVRIPEEFKEQVETFPVRMKITNSTLLIEMIKSLLESRKQESST